LYLKLHIDRYCHICIRYSLPNSIYNS